MALAFGVWFGMETAQRDSLLHVRWNAEIALLSLLGLLYFWTGGWLRRTSFASFAGAGEKLGLLLFHGFLYPYSLKFFHDSPWDRSQPETHGGLVFGLFAALALGVVASQLARDERLDRQWRWAWVAALAACVGMMALAFSGVLTVPTDYWFRRESLASG